MADNYLEAHYEEYLKRKAEWERKKKMGYRPKKEGTTREAKGDDVKKDEKGSE